MKHRVLVRKYGITIEEYEQMLKDQNGVCKICKGPDPAGKDFAVDHCHVTGKVRGLLCQNCNTSLGLMKDSHVNLSNAINYLSQQEFCWEIF